MSILKIIAQEVIENAKNLAEERETVIKQIKEGLKSDVLFKITQRDFTIDQSKLRLALVLSYDGSYSEINYKRVIGEALELDKEVWDNSIQISGLSRSNDSFNLHLVTISLTDIELEEEVDEGDAPDLDPDEEWNEGDDTPMSEAQPSELRPE